MGHMSRRHDIDALRALAFALLILYHIGMLYVAEWEWHVKSKYLSETLQTPMLTVNRWRMDLIFLISGISSALLFAKFSMREFIKQRTWRLVLPFVFGCLVIVPIQPYCQGVMNGLVEPGFLTFLGRYYTGYAWPENAFNGWKNSFTWNHLWYLLSLIFYTAIVVLLQKPLASRAGKFVEHAFTNLRGARLLIWPSVVLVAYTLALQIISSKAHEHAIYFSMFLAGWWLASAEALWRELARMRHASLIVMFASYALYMAVRAYSVTTYTEGNTPLPLLIVVWILRNVYIWAMLCTILGWAHVYLNCPFRWLPWANEAVYPWYVLHQSVIILLAYWLIPLKLGGAVESLLVIVGTVLTCWLITSGVIRRVRWLRPLFGLKSASTCNTVKGDYPRASSGISRE
jgi:glucans biosynthesis protein C